MSKDFNYGKFVVNTISMFKILSSFVESITKGIRDYQRPKLFKNLNNFHFRSTQNFQIKSKHMAVYFFEIDLFCVSVVYCLYSLESSDYMVKFIKRFRVIWIHVSCFRYPHFLNKFITVSQNVFFLKEIICNIFRSKFQCHMKYY